MGAWGYKSFDNDTASEFISEMLVPVEKILKKKRIYNYEYDEFRAAAEFVIRMSPCYIFDKEIIEPLLDKLQFIIDDVQWIKEWNSPVSIRRDLTRQITDLTKISKKNAKLYK